MRSGLDQLPASLPLRGSGCTPEVLESRNLAFTRFARPKQFIVPMKDVFKVLIEFSWYAFGDAGQARW